MYIPFLSQAGSDAVCRCGNVFTNTEGVSMGSCDDPCPGDNTEFCGSPNHVLIMSTSGKNI